MPSGDDIGGQDILEARDLVLQHQLLLLQPPQGELIGPPGAFQRMNRFIKIAMLLTQDAQPHLHHLDVIHFETGIHVGLLESGLDGNGP